jgi:hypothetical protein
VEVSGGLGEISADTGERSENLGGECGNFCRYMGAKPRPGKFLSTIYGSETKTKEFLSTIHGAKPSLGGFCLQYMGAKPRLRGFYLRYMGAKPRLGRFLSIIHGIETKN